MARRSWALWLFTWLWRLRSAEQVLSPLIQTVYAKSFPILKARLLMPYTPPAALSLPIAVSAGAAGSASYEHEQNQIHQIPTQQLPELLPPALHPQSPPSSVLYLHGFLAKRTHSPKLSESRSEFFTTRLGSVGTSSNSDSNNSTSALYPSRSMVDLRSDDPDLDLDEQESDDERPSRMVRKKSGELVKPSLKSRRPSSVPSTPTYPKNVHFDTKLEHVRHFLQAERPTAVSNPGSPVDETEAYFPQWLADAADAAAAVPDRTPSPLSVYDWSIVLPNFPSRASLPLGQLVYTERVFLAPDQRSLLGHVAVRNVAFNKWVAVKFTVDYWKTISEVAADYTDSALSSVPRPPPGYDRFTFSIKLGDFFKLEQKTLLFCVRYFVNGTEYWDSNNGANFQVQFRRKLKQLPRAHYERRLSDPEIELPPSFLSYSAAPKPPRADSHDYSFESFFTNPVSAAVAPDPHIMTSLSDSKLRSSRSTTPTEIVPPAGRPFNSRYDFRTSLNAVISASSSSSSSALTSSNPSSSSSQETIVPSRHKQSSFAFNNSRYKTLNSSSATPSETGSPVGMIEPTASAYATESSDRGLAFGPSSEDLRHVNDQLASLRVDREKTGMTPSLSAGVGAGVSASTPGQIVKDKPSIDSTSYQVFLDNFCFVSLCLSRYRKAYEADIFF